MPAAAEPDSTAECSEAGASDGARVDVGRFGEGEGPRLRGLLHDLGHGLATLSYLAETLREDSSLSRTARERLSLVERELVRLLELAGRGAREPVASRCGLRAVAAELTTLTGLSASASVHLWPGPEVLVRADRTVVRRMLGNVLDNAVRAAGPNGKVEVSVLGGADGTGIAEIVDNGPGFGRGPSGTAALGLGIVAGLARGCGANLRIGPANPHGTRVRLIFPRAGRTHT